MLEFLFNCFKMLIEIRLCNPIMYIFKGHVKIVKIYMVKFKESILNRLKIMGFFVNIKYIHKQNVSFNKTVSKLEIFFFHIQTLQAILTIITGKNLILHKNLLKETLGFFISFPSIYTVN